MFDELVAAAGVSGGGAVGGWARVENAACARKLAAMADVLQRRLAADGQRRARAVVSGQLGCGVCRDRRGVQCVAGGGLPSADAGRGVARAAAAGGRGVRRRAISLGWSTPSCTAPRLITDPDARAKVDTELAAQVMGWGPLSVAKTELAIDTGRPPRPAGAARAESRARGRHFDVGGRTTGPGRPGWRGCCSPTTPRRWINAWTRWPPRCAPPIRAPAQQRRADAMGALGRGADRLACRCGATDARPPPTVRPVGGGGGACDRRGRQPDRGHPGRLDGPPNRPTRAATPLREQTIAEALAPPPAPTGTATTNPAVIVGGGLLPAPLLAAKLAGTAKIGPLCIPATRRPNRATPRRGVWPISCGAAI